jgi:hypothetical protein
MNEFTDDDGFSSSNNSRFIKGTLLSWNNTKHWHDRDGLALPSELLRIGPREVLRRWSDRRAELLDTKPLPCPDALNSKLRSMSGKLTYTANQPRRGSIPSPSIS